MTYKTDEYQCQTNHQNQNMETRIYSYQSEHNKCSEIREKAEIYDDDFDHLLLRASAAYKNGEYDALLSYLNAAVPQSENQENRFTEAILLIEQAGDVFFNQCNYEKAVEFYLAYSDLTSEQSEKVRIADKIYEAGDNCYKQALYKASLLIYSRGLSAVETVSTKAEANFLSRIGDCYFKIGDYPNAANYYFDFIQRSGSDRETDTIDPQILQKIADAGDVEQNVEEKTRIYSRLFDFIESEFDFSEGEKKNLLKGELLSEINEKLSAIYLSENRYEELGQLYTKWLQIVAPKESLEFTPPDVSIILKKIDEIIDIYIQNGVYEKAQDLYGKMQKVIRFNEDYDRITEKVVTSLEKAKVDERNRLLKTFSHNMKNALIKIRSPLANLQKDFENQRIGASDRISKILKQVEKVEKIATSINFSFKGELSDFITDIEEESAKKSLKELIREALQTAIENILDDSGVYANFSSKYFKLKQKKEVRQIYFQKFQDSDFYQFRLFLSQYFFNLKTEFGVAGNYTIGNRKHSATKLSILFDELVFNAVKYVALVDRKDRFIHIKLFQKRGFIIIEFTNSFDAYNQMEKTSGIGHEVISNMVTMLNGSLKIDKNKETYKTEIRFKNVWENR